MSGEAPRHWRIQKQRYSLAGEICENCGNKIFPPRDICPECEAPAKTPYQLSGHGEVYSFNQVCNPNSIGIPIRISPTAEVIERVQG